MSDYKSKATTEEKKKIKSYCSYINWFFVGFIVFLCFGLFAVWILESLFLGTAFLVIGILLFLGGTTFTTRYCTLRSEIKKRQ
jgi:hypothetical protein